MCSYKEIVYVEKWFENDKNNPSSNLNLEKFMSQHIPSLWEHLDLIDVIMIAKASKSAAYQAYYLNIKKFKTFCTIIWLTKVLDLRKIPQTSNSIQTIFEMFKPKHILLPPQIPYNTLTFLQKACNLTFNLNENTPALIRPRRELKMQESSSEHNLIINGCCPIDLNDPTSDILCSFEKINRLELNNTHIQPMIMASLGTLEIKKLIITNSAINDDYSLIFINNLLRNKDNLTHLEITFCDHNSSDRFLDDINKEIHQFTNLISYKFTVGLIDRQLLRLKKLRKCKFLQRLHIIEISNESNNENRGKNIEAFLTLKGVKITYENKFDAGIMYL